MTTGNAVPTNLPCPGCGALVFYEGHSELKSPLTPHRFHCHSCGKIYVVRSTSHKPPRFALTARHEAKEFDSDAVLAEAIVHEGHDHGSDDGGEQAAAAALDAATTVTVAPDAPTEVADTDTAENEPAASAEESPTPGRRAPRRRKASTEEGED